MIGRVLAFLRGIFSRYEGARFSYKRSRIEQSLTSARWDIDKATREELTRKMRYFEANNPIVQALAGKFENFAVGSSPQVMPSSSDPQWNAKAKVLWDQWCGFCDLTSRQSFGTLMSLAARAWFIDGEAFIVLTEGREVQQGGKTVRRPRIQLIESHLCKTPPELAKDKSIVDGVRLDENGRPVAYYFAEEDADGKQTFGPPRPAQFVIHLFEPSRAGQVRGITFFHAVINELHDLDDMHILEMQAAKANAERVFEIQTQTGEVSAADLIRSRGSRSVTTSTGGTASESQDAYYRDALPNGRVVVTRKGDKINQHAGERPSVVTREYWRYKTELVCAGVEIPYCIVFPDSMQGTVYRGALDMATAFFRSRHSVVADAMRRIWEYVIGVHTKIDLTVADPPDDWRNVSIMPPRAPNVDVGRNSAAMLAELEAGLTDYDLCYSAIGLDWRERLRKKAEQAAFIRELAKEFKIDPSEISTKQVDRPERISTEPKDPAPAPEDPDA